MKNKVYLRIIEPRFLGEETSLDIFEDDIEKDKKHWKKLGYIKKVRYFELKEAKDVSKSKK